MRLPPRVRPALLRACLLAFVPAILLAGCADPAAPVDDVAAPAPAAAPAPEPVTIDEESDLSEGRAPQGWTFKVAPGAMGSIRFWLEPTSDGLFLSQGFCFTFEHTFAEGGAENRRASSSCSDGLTVQGGVQGETVLFEEAPQPGTYTFTFSAQPSLATFRAQAQVAY